MRSRAPAEEKRNNNEKAVINDDDDDDAELKKALAMSLATTNGDPVNPSELLHLMLPVVLANASAAGVISLIDSPVSSATDLAQAETASSEIAPAISLAGFSRNEVIFFRCLQL